MLLSAVQAAVTELPQTTMEVSRAVSEHLGLSMATKADINNLCRMILDRLRVLEAEGVVHLVRDSWGRGRWTSAKHNL